MNNVHLCIIITLQMRARLLRVSEATTNGVTIAVHCPGGMRHRTFQQCACFEVGIIHSRKINKICEDN